MIQIRSGVFETNSSSTHSICIQKKPVDIDYRSIDFYLGDYGWEVEEVDFSNYLYTAIMLDHRERVREHNIEKLKKILDSHHISYTFEKPEFDICSTGTYLRNGYIDHYYDLGNFIESVLNNEDMLLRGLFGENSVVYTGNDNCDEDYSTFYVADPYMTVYDDNGMLVDNYAPNPYHNEKEYDYFLKLN